MSQRLILEIMQELGGRATSSEIIAAAKKKYPDLALYAYVGTRLTQMKKWGDIGFVDEMHQGQKKRVWFIIEQAEPEPGKSGQESQMLYACGVCRASFPSQSKLHSHQSKRH